MGGFIGFIVAMIVVYGIPKWIKLSKRNAMCDEINYCARNGIERDINRSIDLSVKLSTGEITQNQYFDLIASGYTRKEKSNGVHSMEKK